MKKRGLGRNLADLGIGELLSDIAASKVSGTTTVPNSQLQNISVEMIEPRSDQPRRDFAEGPLQELAASIQAQGVLQPIIVRPLAANRYQIIAGERRWRASQLAGLTEMPVLIRDLPEKAAVAVALIENVQRENLTVIEEAFALQRLLDEFTMTHQQVAEAVGKSRASVTNILRLLNLPRDIKDMLQRREIEMGHARALLSLDRVTQLQVAQQIINKGWSVRETEQYIQSLRKTTGISPTQQRVRAGRVIDSNIVALQRNLADKLCLKVKVQHQKTGRGKVVIHYHSLEELEGLLGKI